MKQTRSTTKQEEDDEADKAVGDDLLDLSLSRAPSPHCQERYLKPLPTVSIKSKWTTP